MVEKGTRYPPKICFLRAYRVSLDDEKPGLAYSGLKLLIGKGLFEETANLGGND